MKDEVRQTAQDIAALIAESRSNFMSGAKITEGIESQSYFASGNALGDIIKEIRHKYGLSSEDVAPKPKKLYDYKLNEICNDAIIGITLCKVPMKLVKIGYTFQDKEGLQVEHSLKSEDYEEEEI